MTNDQDDWKIILTSYAKLEATGKDETDGLDKEEEEEEGEEEEEEE